jgi:signal peptidase I
MILQWFLSRTVRQALQMSKHVGKILHAQRDLLAPAAIEAVRKSMQDLRDICARGDKPAVQAAMTELERVANKWLKPHPYPGLRENIEVLLVAIAVAMAIRTFFLQPFKIPTGSMQPTLWGIKEENLDPEAKLPNRLVRFFDFWYNGVSCVHRVAETSGQLTEYTQPVSLALFNLYQSFKVGETTYHILFPPDDLLFRAGLTEKDGRIKQRSFRKGDDILKVRVTSGDHLFVDRLSYNFRRPTRGDIVVFETRHIQHYQVPTDQFYIKRLVGLSGETLSITNRHLVVNGQELTAATPRFANLYNFDLSKGEPPPNHYYGHEAIGELREGHSYSIPPRRYFVMGDNTRNSLDSRYWGGFPRDDVIGKAWFVYWPISPRFGLGYR